MMLCMTVKGREAERLTDYKSDLTDVGHRTPGQGACTVQYHHHSCKSRHAHMNVYIYVALRLPCNYPNYHPRFPITGNSPLG